MRKKPLPTDVPKVWLERNARNQEHLRAALRVLSELSDVYATERTLQEMAGYEVPKGIKKMKRHPKGHVIIGGFFYLETGLRMDDNVICTCADCRTPLQIRPHNNAGGTVLCCFCAVDRAIKEHWAKQEARPAPPQPTVAHQP